MAKKCEELYELKGIQALRMCYLYDGTPDSGDIPPVEIFSSNYYKQYEIKNISKRKIKAIAARNNIFEANRLEHENGEQEMQCYTSLYAFKSFINHGPMNIVTKFMGPSCHITYA